MEKLKNKLCDNWCQAWRWFSMQLHVIGSLVLALLVMMPSLPVEVQGMLPPGVQALAVGLWFILGVAARLYRQKTPEKPDV